MMSHARKIWVGRFAVVVGLSGFGLACAAVLLQPEAAAVTSAEAWGFSSGAAAASYRQDGDLEAVAVCERVEDAQSAAGFIAKTTACSYSCSTGCSTGCSGGCSSGCSWGCSYGCSPK